MLTIFIPSYNHSEYIIECLINVQKISIKNKKIIIIDDASKDDSVSKIDSYIESIDNTNEIIFIKKEENKGVIDSLNLFLSLTTTEYIYLMASDDITVPQGVERLVKILDNNINLKYIIGGANNLFSSGDETPVYGIKHNMFFELSAADRFPKTFLDSPSPILSQSTVIRVSAIKYIGGWNSNIIADDYAMFMQLLICFPEKGRDFEFAPEIVCVKYRHHENNSYHKFERQLLMTIQTLEYLAPENLKNQAVGYKLSYYFLFCLSKAQYRQLVKLILLVPKRSWGWALLRVISVGFSRLKKK